MKQPTRYRTSGRALGAFPTPRELAGFLVDWALGPLLDRCDAAEILFIEPGCGEGPFLLAAFDRIACRRIGRGEDPVAVAADVLLRQLHGIDVDPDRVARARERLLALATLRGGPEVPVRVGSRGPRVVCGDWLLDPGEEGGPPAEWAGLSFHAAAGNPPYVRVEALGDSAAQDLRRRFRSARGKFDLSVPFVERTFGALAPEGRLAFVTTGKFATQNYGRTLREILLTESSLDLALDLSSSRIFGQIAANPLLLGLTRILPGAGARVRAGRSDRLPAPGEKCGREIPQSSLGPGPWRLADEDPLECRVASRVDCLLEDLVRRIGYDYISGCQDAFCRPLTFATARRFAIECELLVPNLRPENVAGLAALWTGRRTGEDTYLLCPHDSAGRPLPELPPGACGYLSHFRSDLEGRRDWDRMTYRESGRKWYELHQLARKPGEPRLLLMRNAIFARCIPDPEGRYAASDRFHSYSVRGGWNAEAKLLLVFLNSSLFDRLVKGRATRIHGDALGLYEFEKKFVAKVPVSLPRGELRDRWLELAGHIVALAPEIASRDPFRILDEGPEGEDTFGEACRDWREGWILFFDRMDHLAREIDRAVGEAAGLLPSEMAGLERQGRFDPAPDRRLSESLQSWLADRAEETLRNLGCSLSAVDLAARMEETVAGVRARLAAAERLEGRSNTAALARILDREIRARRPGDPLSRFTAAGRGAGRLFSWSPLA